MNWQPSASIATLKKRALLLHKIRHFFAERDVLEVETPLLASSGITDLHLENIECQFTGPGFAKPLNLYLQTSPEYAMKRLIAAGSGCIYQLCKAVRNDESGRFHNPEFSMLEWYRMNFNHHDLMQEVDTFLQQMLACQAADYLTYQQAFLMFTHIDPLHCQVTELKKFIKDKGEPDIASVLTSKTDLLQYIFCTHIEHKIGQETPCFVYHFPAAQASLAKLNKDDLRVAERFEVYFKGIELANGFHELTDKHEQLKRFEQDNQLRQQAGKEQKPIDHYLLAALENGLPNCAGVALGIDRLFMLAEQLPHINEAIAFNITNC
ncbi:elongation factor P--(R)-beta-lysine ligase [Algibacillus agarilyticus]|uniref:elongation factor P--(R)-beta-lysine ligase n=1 Tax=Algibacillus agarilyticus TaxID=2234133 RepID=UPI000DD00E7F|nr:elongation factor P--(R)-beta-lysine ligase [Algibacillus agarilyticus]